MKRTKYSDLYSVNWVLVHYSLNRMGVINLGLSAEYQLFTCHCRRVRKFANVTLPGKPVPTHSPSHFSIHIEDVMPE